MKWDSAITVFTSQKKGEEKYEGVKRILEEVWVTVKVIVKRNLKENLEIAHKISNKSFLISSQIIES